MWPYILMFIGLAAALVAFAGLYRMARRPGLVLATEEWQEVCHALAGRVF